LSAALSLLAGAVSVVSAAPSLSGVSASLLFNFSTVTGIPREPALVR